MASRRRSRSHPDRVAEYRHVASVRRIQRTADGLGGWTESWLEVGVSYARVQPASSHRVLRMGKQVGEATHEVAFRELVDVRSTDRVVVAGLDLDVVGVEQAPGEAPITVCMRRSDQQNVAS